MKYIVEMRIHLGNAHFDITKQTIVEAIDEKHAKRKGLKYFENNGWYNAEITNITAISK